MHHLSLLIKFLLCGYLQVLSENELEAEVSNIGSISCDSMVTCLLYWHGRLFAGFSNRDIKVFFFITLHLKF